MRVTWIRVVKVEVGRGRKCREKCPEEYSLKWDQYLSLSGGNYFELLLLFKLFTAMANTQQNHLGEGGEAGCIQRWIWKRAKHTKETKGLRWKSTVKMTDTMLG